MTLPKLKRKAKRFWRKSAKRLGFDVVKKIAVVLLLVGLNWAGLAAVGQTAGFFVDEENSSGNVLSAGSLDIVLTPDSTYASGLMYPGDSASAAINLANSGTLPHQYTGRAEILGGAEACGYFNMAAMDGVYSYSGAIGGFASPASASSGPDDWAFTFSLSSSVPPAVWGQSCFFKWVFSAWQTDFTDPANGFYDTDERLGVLRVGKAVVLNEFIPNPTGLDNASKPGGEWVELYNNSNMSFDLNGWYIYDSTDDGEIPINADHTIGGTVIPAHDFLVVYRDGDSDFILNNDADSVRLFTGRISEGGILIDSYSYSSGKPEGFSFARIPDGVGAWVDPVPTPGRPNVLSGDEVVVQDESFVLDAVSEIAGAFEEIFNPDQTASESQEIIIASGSFEIVASPSVGQDEIANPAPVASESVEPLPESSPELSPEPSETPEPAVTPEPTDDPQPLAGDDGSIQVLTEPVIPTEPVTVEAPTEPAPPPADPPPPPAEAPAPAPEAPAVPTE